MNHSIIPEVEHWLVAFFSFLQRVPDEDWSLPERFPGTRPVLAKGLPMVGEMIEHRLTNASKQVETQETMAERMFQGEMADRVMLLY